MAIHQQLELEQPHSFLPSLLNQPQLNLSSNLASDPAANSQQTSGKTTPTLPYGDVFGHMSDTLSLNGAPVTTNSNANANQPADTSTAPRRPPTVADYGTTLDAQLDTSINANRIVRKALDAEKAAGGDRAAGLQEDLNGDRRTLLNQLNERSGVYDQDITAIDQQLGGKIPKNPTAEQQALIARRQQLVQGRDKYDDQQTALQRWSDRQEINDINQQLQNPALTPEQRTQLTTRKRTLATGLLSTVKTFQQFDPRWGDTVYGKDRSYSTMTEAGCGPTSLAMAMDFHDQEDPEGKHSRGEHEYYTPRRMADYTTNHGRVKGSGTAGQVMMDDLHGSFPNVEGNTLNTRANATESLNNGIPVIMAGRGINGSTANGDAARQYQGHFMVLSGVSEDGQTFNVSDGGRRPGRNITSMTRQQLGDSAYGYWNVGDAQQ